MGSYWDASGKLVDGRYEIVAGSVADTQTLWTPGMLYNETTSDKPRGNTQGTLLASAVRTATTSSPNMTNYNARGIIVSLYVTVASGTGGLTVRVGGQDNLGGSYYLNTAPTAIIAAGYTTYVIYPSASAGAATQATSLVLPRSWSVSVLHTDATSYTYYVTYALIL